ncbi:hypothetical protein IWX90DRAFT_136142 [Phyllosticta citrichinensis]|uniref:Uncharacterized protein n=1 Tax=Phyllosticta citrichinensis TaxID=1130410 RepID=A0ABR1XYF8_9PEZI
MTSRSGAKRRKVTASAPTRMLDFYRHYKDHDGYPSLSHWCGKCCLPPLFSFQVYVTYDVSAAERSGLEALAKRLHQTPLAGTLDASLIRLDLHFLEPNTSTKDCVAHHNHGKVFAFDDPSLRIMPSYICSGYHRWNSYFYKILNPDCDGAKSTSVSFDSESSDGATDGVPFLEEPTSIDAAQEASVYFYGSTDAKDCEVVYELAGAAGLTEW